MDAKTETSTTSQTNPSQSTERPRASRARDDFFDATTAIELVARLLADAYARADG